MKLLCPVSCVRKLVADIGLKLLPVSIAILSRVLVAVATLALVGPTYTTLLSAMVLKLVPDIITVSPGLPIKGVQLVMVVTCD